MAEGGRSEWHELWATFSVKDDCRPDAFIAEVLLYDKLVIPVPPTQADEFSKQDVQAEAKRWADREWDPERQANILRILEDRAEPIAWTADRQAEWRAEMKKSFGNARRNGYFASGRS